MRGSSTDKSRHDLEYETSETGGTDEEDFNIMDDGEEWFSADLNSPPSYDQIADWVDTESARRGAKATSRQKLDDDPRQPKSDERKGSTPEYPRSDWTETLTPIDWEVEYRLEVSLIMSLTILRLS